MKIYLLFLLSGFIFAGCVPGKSNLSVSFSKKNEAVSSNPSVSSVQIVNNQLVIHGVGLSKVSTVNVNGNSLSENFTIESQSATKIIANSIRAVSFDVSKVFNLILSDANASATFQIDFSLCHATLNGAGFDCSAAVADNDVLTYDLASNTWIPRALSGLSYKGVWDANTAAPTSTQSGQYYIVSVANLPTYKIGDWIVWNGSSYDIVAQSGSGGGAISTVFGRTGTVVAKEGDYNLDKLLDVDLTTPPTTGQVLKYDGTKWIADDEAGGSGGPGSVTTAELADGSVTNVKIADVAASKITGTITSAQITDGTIANADISATAAIAYSKLSIPALSIPYAQLNIADGDIPAVKIAGLPSATAVLTTAITDGDTTHAPDANVVFDTLATKLDKTGGTITTMLNVPTPVLDTEATTKLYVDTTDNLKANKAGDTFSGVLTLDNDLKIKGGSNYVTVKGNAASAAYTLTLPIDAGTNNQVLTTNGSGVLSWTTPAGSGVTLTGDVGGTAGANTIGTGKVTSTHILDGTIANADINAAAAIDYSKLNVPAAAIPLTALNATGTKDATKYLKGDDTWATLTTDVLATALNGLSLTNAVITATDTVLSAFGKLQKQITDSAVATMSGDLTGTLPSPTVAKIKGVAVSATAPTDGQFFKYTSSGTNWVPSFVTVTDLKSTALGNLFPGSGCAANQTLYYSVVGDSFSCVNIDSLDAAKITTGTIAAARLPAGASYWVSATGGINYAGGNVGIGATSPAAKLDVNGLGKATLFYAHGTGQIATNTAYGLNALNASTTGTNNTAIGVNALQTLTTSSNNTAVGTNALSANTSGNSNIALGTNAMSNNTTGTGNVALGKSALAANTTGGGNIATGDSALAANTTAWGNTAYGDNALIVNSTGAQNVGIGSRALYVNTTGNNNISVGRNSLAGNTTGTGNVAFGFEAGYTSTPANANSTGTYNTYLGFNAGPGTATQLTNSAAIGANASVTASNSIVLGDSSVKVGIGTTAPTGKLSIEGTGAVGMQMKSTGAAAIDTINLINDMNATGNFWIAKGASASAAPAAADKLVNITNLGNVEIYGQQVNGTNDYSGVLSLKTQTSASGGTKNEVSMEFYADRTSIGTRSGYFGYESGTAFDMTMMNSKSANIIFGTNNSEKVRITTDGYVGIGNNNPTKALSVNGEMEALTVTANTVAGATLNAGNFAISSGNSGWVIGGFRNTAADGYSGFSMLDNTGTIKGFSGYANSSAAVLPGSLFYTSSGTGVPLLLGTNQTERVRITDTGVGINGSNGAYMLFVNGTAGGTSAYVNASDRRLKKDIVTIPNALERVGQLRGVNYNWNHDVHPELALGYREEMGVIAQEVEKVFPDAVSEDKTNGIKSVAYTMLIAPLIEAVKTLHKMVVDVFSVSQKHSREIASVKSDLANKDQEIKKLQQENAEMKARLDRMEKILNKK